MCSGYNADRSGYSGNEKLENAIKVFVQEYFYDKEELFIYLTAPVKSITLRMKNAAVYGMLSLGIW